MLCFLAPWWPPSHYCAGCLTTSQDSSDHVENNDTTARDVIKDDLIHDVEDPDLVTSTEYREGQFGRGETMGIRKTGQQEEDVLFLYCYGAFLFVS